MTQRKTCNYIELFGSSTRDRHARRIISADVQRITLNASCMTISGGKTKQHVVIRFGELAAVDILIRRHSFSILTE